MPDGGVCHIAAQRQLRQHHQLRLRQRGEQRFDLGLSLRDALDVVVQLQCENAHSSLPISIEFPNAALVRAVHIRSYTMHSIGAVIRCRNLTMLGDSNPVPVRGTFRL